MWGNIKNALTDRLPNSKYGMPILLALVVLALYAMSIVNPQWSFVDDEILLEPIFFMKNFFREYLANGKLEVQPLRDLSFFLDIQVYKATGVQVFHATNAIIFIVILVLTREVLDLFIPSRRASAVCVLLLAVHPVMVNTVCWISARKHLLANMYILAAILAFERYLKARKKRDIFYTWLLVVFSIFSQPIHVLWPFWAALRAKMSGAKWDRQLVLSLIGLMVTGVGLTVFNMTYYYVLAKTTTGVNVGGTYDLVHLTNIILAHGRYFFNSVLPYWTTFYYSKGAWANVIGLYLLVPFLVWAFKKDLKNTLLLCGMGALALAPVTIHKIGNFVHDTYMPLYLICLFALITVLVLQTPLPTRFPRSLTAACMALFIAFATTSALKVRQWNDFESVMKDNLDKEHSDVSFSMYVAMLFAKGKLYKAMPYAKTFISNMDDGTPVTSTFWRIIGTNIYKSDSLYRYQKLKAFKDLSMILDPDFRFFWAMTALEDKKLHLVNQILSNEIIGHINAEHKFPYQTLALYYIGCRQMEQPDCSFVVNQALDKRKDLSKEVFGEYLQRMEDIKDSIWEGAPVPKASFLK